MVAPGVLFIAEAIVAPVEIIRYFGEFLQTALIALLLFLAVNLITARIRVEGISMEPSLHDGQFVVVNRLAYRWQEPIRGDIIVFYFPQNPSRRFIKRVIGLPGDTIDVQSGHVYVNDVLLEEPYIAAPANFSGEWLVGRNEVFVLGDNRNNSSDSPDWGGLPINEIIGKAIFVYWPLDTVGLIPHYNLVGAAEE
ncbi:MAG: signal peptidase I [Anaerolineales bacterium]